MHKLISLLAVALMASGCATGPRLYDDGQSRAFNIARAGGLITGIQDTKVDEEAYTALTERGSYQVADAAVAGMSTGIGISAGEAVGLSLLQSAVAPDSHGARHSLIAWMPIEMADSEKGALSVMLDETEESIKAAFDDMGLEYDVILKRDDWMSFMFYNEEWNCGEWIDGVSTMDDICTVKVRLREPHTSWAEDYISGVDGDSYFFDSSHGFKYNEIQLNAPTAKDIPESAIYTSISAHLPSWVYLYIPANHVQSPSGDTNPLPYFLEDGKQLFFLYPQ